MKLIHISKVEKLPTILNTIDSENTISALKVKQKVRKVSLSSLTLPFIVARCPSFIQGRYRYCVGLRRRLRPPVER